MAHGGCCGLNEQALLAPAVPAKGNTIGVREVSTGAGQELPSYFSPLVIKDKGQSSARCGGVFVVNAEVGVHCSFAFLTCSG